MKTNLCDDVAKAWKDYENKWFTWNEILYKLCRKYQTHNNTNHIAAKIGLIGRSTNSGLERHAKKDIAGIVNFFYSERKHIDDILQSLSNIRKLTKENLDNIIGQHGRFLRLLRKITKNHDVRSFASKYMHFHCPLVPIFDKNTSSALKELYPIANKNGLSLSVQKDADPVYFNHCVRFFAMWNDCRLSGIEDVRRLDHYLFYYKLKK